MNYRTFQSLTTRLLVVTVSFLLLIVSLTHAQSGDLSDLNCAVFPDEILGQARISYAGAARISYAGALGDEVRDNMKGILTPSLANFTPEQSDSTIELLDRVSTIGGQVSDLQRSLIDQATGMLRQASEPKGKWE